MLKFERLLDKLIKENKIDKLDLFKRLNGNSTNILEEHESQQSNDMLLDEQIMEAEEDSQIETTSGVVADED